MLKKLPKHIVRLLFLIVFFLLLAFAAKVYLTDPSFYKYGHYRADAIPELAAGTPLFKGTAYCQTCHDEKRLDTSVGAHISVQCEVCHGTNRDHPDDGKMLVPADTPRLCLTCHEKMPARPARQPQIVAAEHPSPEESTSQCHSCHNPHSPEDDGMSAKMPDSGIQTGADAGLPAELSALISKCAKCHGKQGEGRRKNPALAGLDAAVFTEQMNRFKSGTRESKKMAKYAKPLSDTEITELARYYESLSATPPENHPE
jgi:predicted CXXCH cytochrome family protein